MALNKKISDMKQEMTRWRQRLHEEPELAFDEAKTARFITRQLTAFGLEVKTMAKTGVIGILHGRSGKLPADDGAEPKRHNAIMLRADMDALPLDEKNEFHYKSRNPGVHHACGHDGHMAMLLGAAKYLAETKDFDGTIYFVFQPAEEHIGGAKEMVKEGLFEKFPCDAVYGLHNFPGLPLGMMATGKGAILAASDEYHVSFSGDGGHSARPENTTDVLAAAAEAVMAIKALAKSDIPDDATAVLSVCALHSSSTAANVLPDEVSFNGSIRTFDPDLHASLKKKLEDIVLSIAEKYDTDMKIEFKNGYPMLINHDAETDFAIGIAKDIVGDDKVMTAVPKTLGVEDFATFLQNKPGNFMAVGTGRADGKETPDLHHCKYDFNDAALPYGASYWVKLAETALPLQEKSAHLPARPPQPKKKTWF